MSRTVLVTGATGAVGPALVEHLVEAGSHVRILARSQPAQGILPKGVEVVCGDITDCEALAKTVENVDVIYHLAAKLHINHPGPALRDEYYRVNVMGTAAVAAAAIAAGVRRVIYFSSIAVYGTSRRGEIFDERTPVCSDSLYAETKSRAEQIVLGARQAGSDVPLGVVLRLASVYGPRVKGNYARLVSMIAKGLYVQVGDGSNRRTLVYDRDVAAAAVLAATHPAAAGQVYNVTDGQIHSFKDIVAAIKQGFNRRAMNIYLPGKPLRVIAGVAEDCFRMAGKEFAVNRALLDKMLEDVAVSGTKIQDELGFLPRYDLASGWKQAIAYRLSKA